MSLDEIDTRGTDFKFPDDFGAAVTLGDNLTKDRLVEACMRMRKLGKHHWLTFWSSNKVHHQIGISKQNLTLLDILRWVYKNSQQATWNGLHHWATQSLSFQRKLIAFEHIQQSWKYIWHERNNSSNRIHLVSLNVYNIMVDRKNDYHKY